MLNKQRCVKIISMYKGNKQNIHIGICIKIFKFNNFS